MIDNTENVIRHKVRLLNLAEELQNVSRACKVMGVSRDTFYRYKEAVEAGGVEALTEKTRRKPNPRNRIDTAIEEAAVDYAVEQPAHGQVRASNELRKRGIFVSPTGVRGAWLRHDLEPFKKRLKALETKAAAAGWVYSEAQVAALEKRAQEREPAVRLRPTIPAIWAPRTPIMSGISKALAVFTSRPSSTPIPRWLRRSCIRPRPRSPQRIC